MQSKTVRETRLRCPNIRISDFEFLCDLEFVICLEFVILELTRFRGHLILREKGEHDAKKLSKVPT